MINIRRGVKSDAQNMLDMLNKLDTETKFMLFEPGERSSTVHDIERRLSSDDNYNLTIVIDDNDKIGGFLSCNRNVNNRVKHTAYIVIGILNHYTGRGLGNDMFNELDIWAKNNNITRLGLTVIVNNHRAIKLYEKVGFKIEGSKKNSMIIDGEYVDEYYMYKLLDN